jgi:hypothetical protein
VACRPSPGVSLAGGSGGVQEQGGSIPAESFHAENAPRLPASPEALPIHWLGRGLAVFSVSLYILIFILQCLDSLQERAPRYDAQQYITLAYHIVHHGTFSLNPDEPGKTLWPTMHRAPAYPLFLALGIWASPGVRALDLETFSKEDRQAELAPLRWMQLALLLLTGVLASWLVKELTRSRALAFLTLALVGLDRTLLSMPGTFLSEILALFLLTSLSLCLALTVRTFSRLQFAMSGGLLAALALTRPEYTYLGLVLVTLFLLLWLRRPAERPALRAGIAVFLVCFTVPVGLWVGRNVVLFHKAGIATGGGVVLDIRARLDQMTARQFAASFLYWSRSDYLRKELLPRHFDQETVAFLDENSPDGAYQQAYARAGELASQHGTFAADTLLAAEARGRILRHPWRHLATTLPVALRGIYVHTAAISVLLFAALLGAFVMACLRRDAVSIAALLPAAFSFAFHAGLTQNIPRFSEPLLAMLWVSVVLMVSWLDQRTRDVSHDNVSS